MVTGTTLLTRRQAAELLGLAPQTLAVWAIHGRHLPVVKLGRTVRYRRDDLDEFIRSRVRPASATISGT